jgi:hypothetical protein
MGRPIKRKFFGVDNVNDTLLYSEAGGEGVTSITIANVGSNYSAGATISFAASPIGGVRATGTINLYQPLSTSNLAIQYANVTNAGTGYISAPAITIVAPANVTVPTTAWSGNTAGNILTVSSTTGLYVGMHSTGVNLNTNAHITAIYSANSNVVLSSGNIGTVSGNVTFYDRGVLQNVGALTAVLASPITTANTIQANAWVTGGTIGKVSEINAQRGSRRYKVTNADGVDTCRLVPTGVNGVNSPSVAQVTSAKGPTALGQMTLQATDSAGGTYWVGKLESRTALLFPGGTGTPGTQFSANTHVRWTSTGVAVVNSGTATNPSADAVVKIATNN